MNTKELNLLVEGAKMYRFEGFEAYHNMSDDMSKLLENISTINDRKLDRIGTVETIDALSVTQPGDIEEVNNHLTLLSEGYDNVNHGDKMLLASTVKRAGIGGDVYVAKSYEAVTDTLQKVVMDLHPNNQIIVSVDEEVLVEELDFKRLSEINLAPAALYDMSVSKETRDEILGETSRVGDIVRGLKYKWEKFRE